ncbi:MAG: ribose 5-phosphate isomerase B [Clostridia bacterium]|nr:ribose 5-phosphate isomerase B [Clostridia bacterium]
MKIAIANDHGALNLKRDVKKYLLDNGYDVVDFGTNSSESCDYPDYGLPAAEAVASGECDMGILMCSTGIGMSLVANKVPGIRCAHCHDTYCAEYTRRHNNANVLAMGEKVVGPGLALQIVKIFLETEFEGGRHQRRVDKITAVEKKYSK